MKNPFLYIARGLMSLIFLFAGAGKLMSWQGTVDALAMKFSNWYMHLEGGIMTSGMHEFLIGSAEVILGIAVFLEIVGALLLLFGIKVRMGAFFLLMFLIPTTLIFHPFWFEIGPDQHREAAVFLKNLAIIGALLYLVASPGPQREVKVK